MNNHINNSIEVDFEHWQKRIFKLAFAISDKINVPIYLNRSNDNAQFSAWIEISVIRRTDKGYYPIDGILTISTVYKELVVVNLSEEFEKYIMLPNWLIYSKACKAIEVLNTFSNNILKVGDCLFFVNQNDASISCVIKFNEAIK